MKAMTNAVLGVGDRWKGRQYYLPPAEGLAICGSTT